MAMNIDTAVEGPISTRTAERGQGSSKLGKDEFLKLMMTQLGHQDPTAPMDSEAFVAQLAQFASLELMQNSNGHLESLMLGQTAANQTSTAGLVGKEVLYKTDKVTLAGGEPASIRANLAAPAENVTAAVVDASGKTVRTLELGRQGAGLNEMKWDGRSEGGMALPPGEYSVRITAADAAGKSVEIEQRGHARVTGVSFEAGYPELKIAGGKVKMSEVLEINERNTP